jgi:UDP-glucuronate 4-epimerase
LKEAQLAVLSKNPAFRFYRSDIADRSAMEEVAARHSDITRIIHLAAQAGVRYSLVNPYAYAHSNIDGQVVMLELARHLENCEHFVYALAHHLCMEQIKSSPFRSTTVWITLCHSMQRRKRHVS